MKLLLDENLSPRLVAALSDVYPGLHHVNDLGLGGAGDSDVWQLAKQHRYAIVSKDSDFASRVVLDTDAPKVIWVRIGNCSTPQVEALLRFARFDVNAFITKSKDIRLLVIGRGTQA